MAALLYFLDLPGISMGFSTPVSFHSFLNSISFWHGILGNFLDLDTSQGKLAKRAAISYILVLVLSLSYLHLFYVLISYLCTASSAVIIFSSPVFRMNYYFYLLILMFWKAGTWCLFLFHCPIRHQVSTSS